MPASELLINVETAETRAALIEEGIITELHVERSGSRSIVGNIYLGKVGRVMSGMQAAFVDIGLERHAFLQVGDTVRAEDFEALTEGSDEPSPHRRVSKRTPIGKVLSAGQNVVVQVSRGPVGSKGARVTSHVSLAGRQLVYLPTLDKVGVSRRIQDDKERRRLARLVDGLRSSGGFIIRTVAEGATEEVLAEDVESLTKQWTQLLERHAAATAPALLQGDRELTLRVARDLLGDSVHRMVVDDRGTFERLEAFVAENLPDQASKLAFYQGDEPIFDAFGIEDEVQRALARQIPLPSGGSLVIDHGEALTAIDVNSGRFSGGKDLEDTITQTNLEAVVEVAYQLRLRNIGGLIVVDFIDMERLANRDKVNKALREAMRADRAQSTVLRISELGLVEMTRKGSTKNLARLMFEPCQSCGGTGQVKSRLTLACDIVRELKRRSLELRSSRVIVECHPMVAEVLSDEVELREALAEVTRRFGKEVEVKPRQSFHIERFDIKGGRKHG